MVYLLTSSPANERWSEAKQNIQVPNIVGRRPTNTYALRCSGKLLTFFRCSRSDCVLQTSSHTTKCIQIAKIAFIRMIECRDSRQNIHLKYMMCAVSRLKIILYKMMKWMAALNVVAYRVHVSVYLIHCVYIFAITYVRSRIHYKHTQLVRLWRASLESAHFSIVTSNRIYFHCVCLFWSFYSIAVAFIILLLFLLHSYPIPSSIWLCIPFALTFFVSHSIGAFTFADLVELLGFHLGSPLQLFELCLFRRNCPIPFQIVRVQ